MILATLRLRLAFYDRNTVHNQYAIEKNTGIMSAGDVNVSNSFSLNDEEPLQLFSHYKTTVLMPVGTFFQTVPSSDATSGNTVPPSPSTTRNSNAATQLSEAIDEFLGDAEQKFKVMNDEILTKCSRLSSIKVYNILY